MGYYEPVQAKPIIGLDADGKIAVAATVLGRATQFGRAFLHVATWEAGREQREDYITPAAFESWRRSFVKPDERN